MAFPTTNSGGCRTVAKRLFAAGICILGLMLSLATVDVQEVFGVEEDEIFDIDIVRMIENEWAMPTEDEEAGLPGDEDYTSMATDATAERRVLKARLENELIDLEWELRIPVVHIDSKTVLLKSYLRSLIRYYRMLKDKKTEFDSKTKERIAQIIEVLRDRYRHLPPAEQDQHITDDLNTADTVKSLISDYYSRVMEYKDKAGLVVKYIWEVDSAITKLKAKKAELEVAVIAQQLSEQVDTILKEVRDMEPEKAIDSAVGKRAPIGGTDSDVSSQQKEEIEITPEAIATFLLDLGL